MVEDCLKEAASHLYFLPTALADHRSGRSWRICGGFIDVTWFNYGIAANEENIFFKNLTWAPGATRRI